MTLGQFEEFLYGACLLDWDHEGEQMRRIAERLDAGDRRCGWWGRAPTCGSR